MIGIIGALDIEVKDIISEMDNPTTKTFGQLHFTSGRIGKTDCVVAKCGIGKVNAAVCTQTMILNYSPDMIINTGIAGSTSSKTHIGSVVIADAVVQHDFDTTALGDERSTLFMPDGDTVRMIPCDKDLNRSLADICSKLGDIDFTSGTIATGDVFIATIEQRRSLNELFGAIACEMEGGSIGYVCYINNVPFSVLRSISDDSSSDEGSDIEYSTFSKMAAEKAVRIINAFISSQSISG